MVHLNMVIPFDFYYQNTPKYNEEPLDVKPLKHLIDVLIPENLINKTNVTIITGSKRATKSS